MTFKINMAALPFMFICLAFFAKCEVQIENGANSFESHSSEISAVLNHLNSSSFKVYNYKEATLLHAHTKADITELALEVSVDCVNKYPEIPCTGKILNCHAFVRKTAEGLGQVLNDVNCKPKPEIIIEESPYEPPINPAGDTNQIKSIVLSNEAVSSEVHDEPFVAIRRDSVPCLGCPFDLNHNAEGVDELIDLALQHVESERPQKQALVRILKVQQQVVAGVKYILIIELGSTVCSKDSTSVPEGCPVDSTRETNICKITYLQKPWISKTKHIINNNCTVSQEFVKSDGKKSEISNDIEPNEKTTKAPVSTPNFDDIAESGSLDMSPSRLSDLESQILLEFEDIGQSKKNIEISPPKVETVVPSTAITQTQVRPEIEDDGRYGFIIRESATLTAKIDTEEPTTATVETTVKTEDEEQRPKRDESSEESDEAIKDESKSDNLGETTTERVEDEEESKREERSEERKKDESSGGSEESKAVGTTEKTEDGEGKSKRDDSSEEKRERNKDQSKSDSSSEESKDSSEEKSQKKKSKDEEDSSESHSHSSEERPREKRAIPQLEKITPEEKGLVKNLADFAAAALDNIDDDNHKRIILQILGAKKMVGDDGVYYHLIMRMGISRCLEDGPTNPYENCREKLLENYTKICKVQVYVNDDFGSPKVVKSQCQNIKRDQNDSNRTNYSRFKRQIMAGGPTSIDINSERVKNLLHQGLTLLNSEWNKERKYVPVEVLSATSQVVAGALYKIRVKIGESDCDKNDVKDLNDCHVVQGTAPKTCLVKVWEKVWQDFRQFTISCDGEEKNYKIQTTYSKRSKRQVSKGLPGGEFPVSEDDEDLKKYLEASLTQLDTETEHENKLKVHEIVSATRQIVAGEIYRIKAKIIVSDCKKTSNSQRHECGTLKGSKPRTCSFQIFEALWIPNSRTIQINCDQQVQKRDLWYPMDSGSGFTSNDDHKLHFALFNNFIKKHKKEYSKKEFKKRFEIFRQNLFRIRVLNTYEQGSATYGITRFADLTETEFSKSLGFRTDLRNENEPPFAQAKIPDVELPTEFDWRTKDAVTEVKDQGQCGSCWAFSVTGNVEGQYAIKHGKLVEFSEQELVDCDKEDQGCNGGLMDNAYREIEKMGGLETENDYPYDAEDEKCHFNESLARVQLSGALNISHNETDMAKWLVANGPISIAINANAMQFYFGGVSHPFKFLCSPSNLDHGVLIVGYGVRNYSLFNKTLPYWIVKNSWGKSWGEQGYYRVYRGDGTCGLNETPSSAIVV